jgi:hypothetical protein
MVQVVATIAKRTSHNLTERIYSILFGGLVTHPRSGNFYVSMHRINLNYHKKNQPSFRNRAYRVIWTMPSKEKGQIKVCKTFFLHTLSVSETMVRTTCKKEQNSGVFEDDMRGKHVNRKNKVSDHMLEKVETFQCVESHDCRRDSSKSYLPAYLNLKKMYALYIEKCSCVMPVTLSFYRKEFDTEYNLASIHQ